VRADDGGCFPGSWRPDGGDGGGGGAPASLPKGIAGPAGRRPAPTAAIPLSPRSSSLGLRAIPVSPRGGRRRQYLRRTVLVMASPPETGSSRAAGTITTSQTLAALDWAGGAFLLGILAYDIVQKRMALSPIPYRCFGDTIPVPTVAWVHFLSPKLWYEELFFHLWFCVSFWFWREIGLGFTYHNF
jgi:hypothetical protein